MRRANLGVFTLALLGAGCADLQPIELGVCGNRVVEFGEVCDGEPTCGTPDDDATACRWTCERDADCPVDWRCGVDGTCHLPTGSYELRDVDGRPGAGFAVIDVDGDGLDDLVSRDANGVSLYAQPHDAARATAQRVFLPPGSVPGMLDADLDGDRDIVIGLAGGVALLTRDADGAFRGQPQQTLDLFDELQASAGADPLDGCPTLHGAVARFDDPAEASPATSDKQDLVMLVDGRYLYAGECETGEGETCVGACDSCDLANGDEEAAGIPGRNGLTQLALIDPDVAAFGPLLTAPVPGASSLTLVATSVDDPPGEAPPRLRAGVLGTLALPAFFDDEGVLGPGRFSEFGQILAGDLDGAGCDDVISVLDPRRVAVHFGESEDADACTALDRSAAYPLPVGWRVVGAGPAHPAVPYSLVVADAFGTVRAAYLDGEALRMSPAEEIGVVGGVAITALVDDYNADGVADVVVASSSSTLEFFLGTGTGFNRFLVDVPSPASELHAADVDGDLVDDVVAVLAGDDGFDGHDDLVVVYGSLAAQPGEPVAYGTYPAPLNVHVIDGPIAALMLGSNATFPDAETCERPMTIMLGDTSRQLLAPLQLSFAPADGEFDPQVIIDVTPADRADQSGGTPAFIAAGGRRDRDDPSGELSRRIEAVPDDADGGVDLVSASGGSATGGRSPWFTAAVAGRVLRTDGAYLDVVTIDVGKCDGCSSVVRVIDGEGGDILPDEATASWPAREAAPATLALRDIDGDGDDDLLGLQFVTGEDESAPPIARTWFARNDGGRFVFDADGDEALDAIAEFPAGHTCADVAWGPATSEGALPFWAVCSGAGPETPAYLLHGRHDPASGEFRDLATVDAPGAEQVKLGDFDGNGIADVVYVGNRGDGRRLQLLVACEVDQSPAIGDAVSDGGCLPPTPL
jgi:hypothetical protein